MEEPAEMPVGGVKETQSGIRLMKRAKPAS